MKTIYLREYRKKSGLTQSELAEQMGVHDNTIRRWESGDFEPRSNDLQKLCQILNCTEAELLNGPENQKWEIRLVISKTGSESKGDTLDMSGNATSAVLNLSDNAMAITLSAGYDLWEDDAQFEAIIEDLRRKRLNGLKMRKEGW